MLEIKTTLQGNYRIFTLQRVMRVEGYFAGQIGQGNPRRSKIFNFPKKLLYTVLSSFGITSKRWSKIRNFLMKNPRKYLDSAGGNLT